MKLQAFNRDSQEGGGGAVVAIRFVYVPGSNFSMISCADGRTPSHPVLDLKRSRVETAMCSLLDHLTELFLPKSVTPPRKVSAQICLIRSSLAGLRSILVLDV